MGRVQCLITNDVIPCQFMRYTILYSAVRIFCPSVPDCTADILRGTRSDIEPVGALPKTIRYRGKTFRYRDNAVSDILSDIEANAPDIVGTVHYRYIADTGSDKRPIY